MYTSARENYCSKNGDGSNDLLYKPFYFSYAKSRQFETDSQHPTLGTNGYKKSKQKEPVLHCNSPRGPLCSSISNSGKQERKMPPKYTSLIGF